MVTQSSKLDSSPLHNKVDRKIDLDPCSWLPLGRNSASAMKICKFEKEAGLSLLLSS